jgi:hypothetical protein
LPAAVARREAKLLAAAPGDRLAVLAVEHDLGGRRAVEPPCQLPRVLPAFRQAIDHPRPVGGGHKDAVEPGEVRLERDHTLNGSLAVVRADDDGIALEKLVRPARGLDQRADGGVAAGERLPRPTGPEEVRGEVVVREVVDEQVEPVARHEPASDEAGVGVDRALGPGEDGHGRTGHLRLVEAVEEELPRSIRGAGEARDERQVRCAAAVARDVDRGRRQARTLERLVDGYGLASEVLLVHVEDRVEDRAARPGRADGGERRSVLDDPPLFAVPPDEVRDPVHVRMRARGDRGEADRRQRGERGDPAAVASVAGEERERGGGAGLDRVLEHRGREAVDDDEDQLLALCHCA